MNKSKHSYRKTEDTNHIISPSSQVPFEQVSNENKITQFIHCRLCLEESGNEPYDQSIDLGWTTYGLQVWCRYHKANILHINFEGVTHKADTTMEGEFTL